MDGLPSDSLGWDGGGVCLKPPLPPPSLQPGPGVPVLNSLPSAVPSLISQWGRGHTQTSIQSSLFTLVPRSPGPLFPWQLTAAGAQIAGGGSPESSLESPSWGCIRELLPVTGSGGDGQETSRAEGPPLSFEGKNKDVLTAAGPGHRQQVPVSAPSLLVSPGRALCIFLINDG